MSSLFGQERSELSQWFNVLVPPRFERRTSPLINVVEKSNNSVVIKIHAADENKNCKVIRFQALQTLLIAVYNQVSEYHLRFGPEEMFISYDSMIDDKIELTVKNVDVEIQGRVKYEGIDKWSDWISSDDPVCCFFFLNVNFPKLTKCQLLEAGVSSQRSKRLLYSNNNWFLGNFACLDFHNSCHSEKEKGSNKI